MRRYKMSNKIIGFVGIEKYEIIHYLSRILIHLNQKILLADQSEERALACSIPVPFSDTGEIIDYNGVDVSLGLKAEELRCMDYNYILVDFGFYVQHPMLNICDEVYLVSDLQLHNIRSLSAMQLEKHQHRFLILKTFLGNKVNPCYIFEEMRNLMIREENSYALPMEERDYENCLNCQYENQISMKKLSRYVKQLLYEILLPDFSKNQLDRAFRLAERGH